MDDTVKQQLISMAQIHINNNGSDPSHDFSHALRVLQNTEQICAAEEVDLDILIPAALFHDAITYQKDDNRSSLAQDRSAELASTLLICTSAYPEEIIAEVVYAIKTCSFSKNIVPETKEDMILQDADGLEAAGAIAIMRTFSSGGTAWAGLSTTLRIHSAVNGNLMPWHTVLISSMLDYLRSQPGYTLLWDALLPGNARIF